MEKEKILKEKDPVREAFEEYGAKKYTKWGTIHNPDPGSEQKAFEDLVLSLAGSGSDNGAKIIEWNAPALDWNSWLPLAKGENNWTNSKLKGLENVNDGDFIIVTSLDGSNKSLSLFGKMINKSQSDSEVRILGLGLSRNDSYTKQETDDAIKRGGGGGGGGSSVTAESLIPDNAHPITSIEGKYGFNLFNYRDLTANRKIALNGDVFYTREKVHATETDTTEVKNIRIRKKDQITAKYRVLKVDSAQDTLHFKMYDGKGKKVIDLDYSNTTRGDKLRIWKNKTVKPLEYSYSSYLLGGGITGENVKMQVKAWYGDFEPKVLDQRFVFKNYNGYTLRAMQTYQPNGDPGAVEREAYNIYKGKTTIHRKFGVFKLKDAVDYHIELKTKDKYHLLIPIPDDCNPGGDRNPATLFMSNNLVDISAVEAGQALPEEVRPFFVRALTPDSKSFKDFERDVDNGNSIIYDETGKPLESEVEKQCFTIMIKKSELSKWKYLLEKTEIIYELKKELQEEEHLPFGGQIFVMNNKTRIHTCMYETVHKIGTGLIEFKDSPFGYPDTTIEVDNVSYVIDNTGYKAGSRPYNEEEYLPQYLPNLD